MTILWKILKTVAVQDNVESHLCNECEDMNILVNYLKKHIESFHEGVCYPCYQCDYKANTSNLKLYVKLVHEGVVHPWDLCDNKCFWYNFQYHSHCHFSWNVWKLNTQKSPISMRQMWLHSNASR